MELAFAVRELERNAAALAGAQVSCDRCDPDSPRPVPREKCSKCRGSGFVTPAAGEIATDIRRARLALLRGDLESEFDD
jgi:hypothetical protein